MRRMTHSFIRFHQIFVFCLGIFGVAGAGAGESSSARYVFIISYDQGNPDLLQRTELPEYHRMAREGARTWEAYTIVPSITLPSHVSMLTGVGIQKHQVTWNRHDPKRGFVKAPTIFSLAKERGLKTAMIVGKEKFRCLEIPGTVDWFVCSKDRSDAKSVAECFAEEFGTRKPNLVFLHFADPDRAGHSYGVASPQKIQALKDCDEALKIIREAVAAAGALEESVFLLTADHGSHDERKEDGTLAGTHGSAETADVQIPWVAWGKGVKKNFTISAPVVIYDTAATALWVLNVPLPEGFWGRPVISAFE